MGTRDPAALLSIPAAIDFMQRIGLDTFRQHGHELVQYGREQLLAIDGTGPLCTPELSPNATMCCVELPQPSGWQPGYHGHPDALQLDLRDNHGIEIPVGSWNGKRFLRISAHLYNSRPQIDKLLTAVTNSPHLR
jgi:isopenicillin-N epimerase